jgi:serine protease inhibitor
MTTRSREELERALRALGVVCVVEACDALAVVIPDVGDRRFEIDDIRHRALALARAHGFSHLAVELREPERATADRATLSGG